MYWCLSSPSSSQSQHSILNLPYLLLLDTNLVLGIYTGFQLGFKLFCMTSVLLTYKNVLSFLILINFKYGSLLFQKSNQESVFINLTARHRI